MNHKRKVLVIFGGKSAEHEISRISATSILNNIDADKFDIFMLGITKEGEWIPYSGPIEKIPSGEWEDLARREKRDCLAKGNVLLNSIMGNSMVEGDRTIADDEKNGIDVVFPVLHGYNGEDGTIQGFLELAGIPYVGCGVLSSALGMDKVFAKVMFEKVKIPQADFLYFTRKEISKDILDVAQKTEDKFEYPVFVKPSNAGSSVGVSKAANRDELVKALNYAANYDKKVMIEEFINGREVECAVLGNDNPMVSTVGEIVPSSEFYDYRAKYIDNKSKILIPADLPKDTREEIRKYAIKAFKALDCSGLSRVDFFVHKETMKVFINEINTMPGFTDISMYPVLWKEAGVSYGELIERLIDLALERFEDNIKKVDA
ncbi:D-alanine--D-alanine ligase family protein [Herbivorax sp. ANBcel31]|uniref:D-alanine--D-alanine ligase family protein n=1 Tax=Herbivorax sp. ANBcel31 TaxID=3069754 RepID=UPI0027B79C53|nr:D-alanine--D-alanine ligase family protein [Herbivorax sp. ANBcel31]MDQ2084974.1 D-alanine--D-alanine ligase family protein [Herbivorax sp. ANBcel31]